MPRDMTSGARAAILGATMAQDGLLSVGCGVGRVRGLPMRPRAFWRKTAFLTLFTPWRAEILALAPGHDCDHAPGYGERRQRSNAWRVQG
jgi:hypothetical protein